MKVGFIGGSGVYEWDKLEDKEEVDVYTPFGNPSDKIIRGELENVECFFLPRHGRTHHLLPSEVPYKANIYALKKLGVESVISISAVGSLRKEIYPGHIVLPDQFLDRTQYRSSTFFGDGVVAHINLADPICPLLHKHIAHSIKDENLTYHSQGAYICIEGPAFSTRCESKLFHSLGMDIIGMTAMPEVRLAREAELHYATIALATDYDSWHETEEDVNVEQVLATLKANSENVKKVLSRIILNIKEFDQQDKICGCQDALKNSIMTHKNHISDDIKEKLGILINHRI